MKIVNTIWFCVKLLCDDIISPNIRNQHQHGLGTEKLECEHHDESEWFQLWVLVYKPSWFYENL